MLLDTLIFIFALPITHRLQDLPFASAHDVFGTFENFTDWGAGAAVPFTWFAAMWVNSAWMCPVYVAEDTHNASVEIPKSIVMTYVVTAVCGLLVSLLCAFCITDMPTFGLDETYATPNNVSVLKTDNQANILQWLPVGHPDCRPLGPNALKRFLLCHGPCGIFGRERYASDLCFPARGILTRWRLALQEQIFLRQPTLEPADLRNSFIGCWNHTGLAICTF